MFSNNSINEIGTNSENRQYCRRIISQGKFLLCGVILFVVFSCIGCTGNRKLSIKDAENMSKGETYFDNTSIANNETSQTDDEEDTQVTEENTQETTQESKAEQSFLGVSEITSHSIWCDGVEMRVLAYLDEDNMLVKFAIGEYVIQAVVPRYLETGNYSCEFYEETYDGETSVYLKVWSKQKDWLIGFEYVKSEELYNDIINEYDNRADIKYVKTANDYEGFVYEVSDEIAWSEYDANPEWVSGYDMLIPVEEDNMILVMRILDDKKWNSDYEKIVFRKTLESDFYLAADYTVSNYEERMDNLYSSYRGIIAKPNTYFSEENGIHGQNFNKHYVYDISGDNIPEIIFLGSPIQILIISESGYIRLSGTDIAFTYEPGIFYLGCSAYQMTEWDKYKLYINEKGVMTAECIEGDILVNKFNEEYSYYGDTITEEEYENLLVTCIKKFDRPKPMLLAIDDLFLNKKGFYDSVKRINEEWLIN